MDKKIKEVKEVEYMAVSVKPSPIFKGSSAKKLVKGMDKPSNKESLFEKCKELAKIFEIK